MAPKMTSTEAAAVFETIRQAALARGDKARADDVQMLAQFFTNPAFRTAACNVTFAATKARS
jgi:hypothetical protein